MNSEEDSTPIRLNTIPAYKIISVMKRQSRLDVSVRLTGLNWKILNDAELPANRLGTSESSDSSDQL